MFYVYIMTNKRNGTLYVGMTSNLVKRVWDHKHGVIDGFTEEHQLRTLVYIEQIEDVYEAYRRERLLKRWHRMWKLDLIERQNPDWRDLYDEIVGVIGKKGPG